VLYSYPDQYFLGYTEDLAPSLDIKTRPAQPQHPRFTTMSPTLRHQVRSPRPRSRSAQSLKRSQSTSPSRQRLQRSRGADDRRRYLGFESKRPPTTDVYSNQSRGTLGGFWVLGQEEANELENEKEEEERACLILKAAKMLGYKNEAGNQRDALWKRKSAGSEIADMKAWNLHILDQCLPPTPPDSPTKPQSFQLEADYVLSNSPSTWSSDMANRRIPTILLNAEMLADENRSELHSNPLPRRPLPLPTHQLCELPATPIAEAPTPFSTQVCSKVTRAKNSSPISASYRSELPATPVSRHPLPIEGYDASEIPSISAVAPAPRNIQYIAAAICTIRPITAAVTFPQHKGLRKIQAQNSLRRHADIFEQRIDDSRGEEAFPAAPALPAEYQYAVPAPPRAHAKSGSPVSSYSIMSTTSASDSLNSTDTRGSYTSPHTPLSPAVPDFHIPKTSHSSVFLPVTKVNDSTDLSSQSQHTQRKKELQTRIAMREVAHEVIRNRRDERKWEEITEPADLQICLAVLRRELKRRREEIKARGYGVVDTYS